MTHSANKSIAGSLILLFFLFTLAVASSQDGQPGFGLQSGIVSPKIDPSTLNRRIIGATKYKLTPGDAYELVVIIETTERFPLVLGQDYRLNIPYIGTMNVEGMHFVELKQEVVRRIKGRVPVQFVDFLLTAPASFDVFIYGGVKNPGIATVNPLSRISDAVLLGGGLVEGASFRQIELIRAGTKRVVDLSRFATEAALEQNPVLEPNDKIYVPQAEILVEVKGSVKYPGSYEMISGETLQTLLQMAGGMVPDGKYNTIQIVRQDDAGGTSALHVDISDVGITPISNLDVITVGLKKEKGLARITVDGAVYGKPLLPDDPAQIPQEPVVVNFPYVQGLTVLDVLNQMGGPTPLADAGRSYVQRADGTRIPVMLNKIWEGREPAFDIEMRPGDLLVIPMNAPRIFVSGQVNDAGAFPFNNGNVVSDYVAAAGGINSDTGDPNRIYFIDESGGRRRVTLETNVIEPGTIIYVAKNNWAITERTITRVLLITGLVSAIVTLVSDIIGLIP